MREAREWLKRAERDLLAAEINFEQELFEESAFFSHQAAEKALKTLYILKFKRLWKVHDLKELGKRVNAGNNIIKACEALNPHYIETRYPIDVDYTESMSNNALKNAREVIAWVKEKLRGK